MALQRSVHSITWKRGLTIRKQLLIRARIRGQSNSKSDHGSLVLTRRSSGILLLLEALFIHDRSQDGSVYWRPWLPHNDSCLVQKLGCTNKLFRQLSRIERELTCDSFYLFEDTCINGLDKEHSVVFTRVIFKKLIQEGTLVRCLS